LTRYRSQAGEIYILKFYEGAFMMRILIFLLFGILSQTSFAGVTYLDYEELLSQPVTLDPGQARTIQLPLTRHVEKIVISAYGIGQDAMFEVLVDHTVKGTIYVPGQDPSYTVTIAETTRLLTIQHTSGAKVRVTSIVAHYVQNGGHDLPGDESNVAAHLSREIIEAMAAFQVSVKAEDFKRYILPIKTAAGHSYAIATASGDLSRRLLDSLEILETQFIVAQHFFEQSMADEVLFEQCVRALTLRHQLREILD
jgi:hypothetical protein